MFTVYGVIVHNRAYLQKMRILSQQIMIFLWLKSFGFQILRNSLLDICMTMWQKDYVFQHTSSSEEIRGWVKAGVDLFQYIRPFQGTLAGSIIAILHRLDGFTIQTNAPLSLIL